MTACCAEGACCCDRSGPGQGCGCAHAAPYLPYFERPLELDWMLSDLAEARRQAMVRDMLWSMRIAPGPLPLCLVIGV